MAPHLVPVYPSSWSASRKKNDEKAVIGLNCMENYTGSPLFVMHWLLRIFKHGRLPAQTKEELLKVMKYFVDIPMVADKMYAVPIDYEDEDGGLWPLSNIGNFVKQILLIQNGLIMNLSTLADAKDLKWLRSALGRLFTLYMCTCS